jgi:hypothetical protein
MKIVLLHFVEFMGDWQALYIDGRLVRHNIEISIGEFFESIQNHDACHPTTEFADMVITNADDFDDESIYEACMPPTLDGVEMITLAKYRESHRGGAGDGWYL